MENLEVAENLRFLKLTFTCPENLIEGLDKLCKAKGYHRSEAIRSAIRDKLDRERIKY